MPADAMATLTAPNAESAKQFDVVRNAAADAGFAKGMSTGMGQYEAALAPTKTKLFNKLLSALPSDDATVVELGMGTFPNAPYFRGNGNLDIVGVDPNDSMEAFARKAAKANGLSVRVAHGVGEALPFASGSVDAVVCTLTLCSVEAPGRVLDEVARVLKPGSGRFLFCEHVLSETDPLLAAQQRALTPAQVISADGCHLDRRTLETIKAAERFKEVDATYFDLQGFYILNPTVAGIARV